MAKIYIQIELESSDTQTPELLNALSKAILGATQVVETPAEPHPQIRKNEETGKTKIYTDGELWVQTD